MDSSSPAASSYHSIKDMLSPVIDEKTFASLSPSTYASAPSSSYSWGTYVIILLIILLVGANFFSSYLGSFFAKATEQTVSTTAKGAEAIVKESNLEQQEQKQEEKQQKYQEDALNKSLQSSTNNVSTYAPHEATGKAGWCFIGEEESGVRTCSEVGVNDVCMSGDIFPTQAICMNPKLRQ
jgi:hypothetical protein